MKNTVDLTDNRVFRDRPEKKQNLLWSNYGTHLPLFFNPKPIKEPEYRIKYNSGDETFYFHLDDDGWTEYNVLDIDLNSTYTTSGGFSSPMYTFNTNHLNSTDMRHRQRNRIQFVYSDNQLGDWKNIEWSLDYQNKHDVSSVMKILNVKRFISDIFKTPLKDNRYDLFLSRFGDNRCRTLRGCMGCGFYVPDLNKPRDSGSGDYPFRIPEYTRDDERTNPLLYRRSKPSIANLWKNYKFGEKNPLNSWNLDPDFLDEEIEMPRDSTFMDLIGRPEEVIRGIN